MFIIKALYLKDIALFCGDSGNRTRVQTRNQYAFYTLILAFYFRAMARPKPPTIALSAKISFWHRSLPKPVPIFPHRLIHSASGRWLGAMSRFSTLCRNWANLLYFDYAARATVLLPVIMANPINERCSCSACLHTCSTCCQNQTPP